jgi:ABC-2 type transport system ATP-binding protein
VIQVARAEVREAVGHLLGLAWVADLTIEDPPLEEVMRDLFSAPKSPAAEAPTSATDSA